jgi:hypothetical protein
LIGYQQITDEALAQIREELKKFGAVEKNLNHNNQKILGYDHDFPALMEITLELLALSILFDAIPKAPAFTPEIANLNHAQMRIESDEARVYFSEVRRRLSSTQWRSDINSIISDAAILGEQELRQIPAEARPNIDPLDLRYYMIARKTCDQINSFVEYERKEAATKYISHLDRLRQRILDRKQIDQNWQ